ncbi:zinc finger protein Gfi-1b-like [Anopheles maculipalpis]|uniref:zinc finger protein Gfi-1b-like n=1 Tax=Anopheles maculipalpis TaxID=1496333 RepID=UPI002158D90B|nr:zinc finger protein Gfi-1b-like [Anopheles maculipalpis]
MENEPDEILQVCRFCLCQDEEFLIPLEDMLDFSPNIYNIALLTGIQINEANIAWYFLCLECTTKLKSSITFRSNCLSNDALFHEISTVLKASVKDASAPTVETIELLSDDSMDSDLLSLISSLEKPELEPDSRQSFDENLCMSTLFQSPEESWVGDDAETDLFSYSANYIQPGEILFTEPEVRSKRVDWNSSLNPEPPQPAIWRHVPGKRKFHLCDICGRMVVHIESHVPVHKEAAYSCSQCGVKMKQKANLAQHIKQVHMKVVSKTCTICDKSFIHHKTYRYHMLSHEGKSFECQDCSKSFSNIIYLRDHINRLHNAGKQVRQKGPGEKIGRKRYRSRPCVADFAKSD